MDFVTFRLKSKEFRCSFVTIFAVPYITFKMGVFTFPFGFPLRFFGSDFRKILVSMPVFEKIFPIFFAKALAFCGQFGYSNNKEIVLLVSLNRFRKSDAAGATGS